MTAIRFTPLPTGAVRRLQEGGPDAYGQPPERAISDGTAPCRHCLRDTPAGAAMLVLAHRPFPEPQPYAETGPVFLCAGPCAPWSGEGIPPILDSPSYMLRAYDGRRRIRYGTGGIVETGDIPSRAAALLADPATAFVDVRSASNGCFQCRIERA
jgi:Protein of unknown function (DUF1203)